MTEPEIKVISERGIEVTLSPEELKGKTPEEAKQLVHEKLQKALANLGTQVSGNHVDNVRIVDLPGGQSICNTGISMASELAKAQAAIRESVKLPIVKKVRVRELRPASKWPRNALCYCHSGKKFKNCCLLTMKGIKR